RTAACAAFAVWPVACTFQATAAAPHSPSSFRWTSTSNCMPATLPQKRELPSPCLVALGQGGVARGLVGDRVVVVRRDGAAHAHGADDPTVLDERHGAPAEDELVIAQGRDVVGEELPLGEALLEIERGGVKG